MISLPTFTLVRYIEFFELPVLTLLSADGRLYVEKLCTFHEGAVRTLIALTNEEEVRAYTDRRISMLTLFQRDVYLVDTRKRERKLVAYLPFSDIPLSYLPSSTAFYDEPEEDYV